MYAMKKYTSNMTYQNRKKRTAWLYEFYKDNRFRLILFVSLGESIEIVSTKCLNPLASYGSNLDSLHQQ